MSPHAYQRVDLNDAHGEHDNSHDGPVNAGAGPSKPASPPPSFHSRASSPTSARLLSQDDPLNKDDEEEALAEAFGDGEGSDDEDGRDDRQRLMRATIPQSHAPGPPPLAGSDPATTTTAAAHRSATPTVPAASPASQPPPRPQPRGGNDGVFANLSAKPERGEPGEEKPPAYEVAAADATPPYWETTITLPGSGVPGSDEVFLDGLPVGSVFSFAWNAMISMSFQIVGFVLTYLLHTSHAAKNGSRAGLGLTLVQYGFYMKGGSPHPPSDGSPVDSDAGQPIDQPPTDPNAHSADANSPTYDVSSSSSSSSAHPASSSDWVDWTSYMLMIVGWFIFIRAVADFLRARRHEQLVLQSPDRGLPVPIIADGESTERVV